MAGQLIDFVDAGGTGLNNLTLRIYTRPDNELAF